MSAVFDDRACRLGEGPLWHPMRKQMYWFDILDGKLMTKGAMGTGFFAFDEPVSAAGWIDEDSLFMASASGLWRVDLRDGSRSLVVHLESDNTGTRSNDGRADPWGGFWIGTMGLNAEPGAGAIYRYYRGRVRKLFCEITVSNGICFSPDRARAYFTDTTTAKVMTVALDRDGWPAAKPEVWLDLAPEGLKPDGAVVDAGGSVWIAQWGAGRVAVHDRSGRFQRALGLPARQTTCPAFGGEDLATLYVTSAAEGLPADVIETHPGQGMTFAIAGAGQGLAEPRVLP